MKKSVRFLILEDDPGFRATLEGICAEIGPTVSARNLGSAIGHLSDHSFNLLLLDWRLHQAHPFPFHDRLLQFQPRAQWMALFTEPDLAHVVEAMKAGARDILWPGQGRSAMAQKIRDFNLGTSPRFPYLHSFISKLADLVTEKAAAQNLSLPRARKEFSKAFVHEILRQKMIPKTRLASLVNVSPRTLYRHLMVSKKHS